MKNNFDIVELKHTFVFNIIIQRKGENNEIFYCTGNIKRYRKDDR